MKSNLKILMLLILKANQKLCLLLKETIELQEEFISSFILIPQNFFAEFIKSFNSFDLQDLDEDIRANGWEIKKLSEIHDSEEILKIL